MEKETKNKILLIFKIFKEAPEVIFQILEELDIFQDNIDFEMNLYCFDLPSEYNNDDRVIEFEDKFKINLELGNEIIDLYGEEVGPEISVSRNYKEPEPKVKVFSEMEKLQSNLAIALEEEDYLKAIKLRDLIKKKNKSKK